MSSYNRIDRKYLLSDTNTTAQGSLTATVSNPETTQRIFMYSRTGDIKVTRQPRQPYCIRFSSSNPNVSIQTTIPSSERNNYNIYIRGYGSIDLLWVDDSAEYIAIRPKTIVSDTQFYLSYIAFKNRQTDKIDHLFECEESTGTVLYDAVTGEQATLQNVASISALRATNSNKEMIYDTDDLLNRIMVGGEYANGEISLNEIKTLPAIFSIAFEIKFHESLENALKAYDWHIIRKGATSKNEYLYFKTFQSGVGLYIKTKTNTNGQYIVIPHGDDIYKSLFDGKFHKIIIIANETKYAWYVDGILAKEANRDVVEGFVDTSYAMVLGWSNNNVTQPKIEIANFNIFNFDISSPDAKYTMSDFVNTKDIPSEILSATYPSSVNKLYMNKSGSNFSGTYTQTSDNIITCDNFSYQQWLVTPSNTTTSNYPLLMMPGSEITLRVKFDGYGTKTNNTTNLSSLASCMGDISFRQVLNANYTANYNSTYYYTVDKFVISIYDETGNLLSTRTKTNTLNQATYLTAAEQKLLLRPVETYTESQPRILEVTYRLAPNIIKQGALTTSYVTIGFKYNTNISEGQGHTLSYTGTIELLDVKVNNTALISLNNFYYNYNWCWKNRTSITNSVNNSVIRKCIFPGKNYGTFANAYGYTNTSNLITPRKITV